MAKSKTIQKTEKPIATEPPVIKLTDLSMPLRTLIILAGVAGALLIMYFAVIIGYVIYGTAM